MTTRLRELLGKATKGRFVAEVCRVESEKEHGWINDGWIICDCDGPDGEANAALFAEMKNTLPALLDAIDEARGALRDCKEELWDEWHSGMSEGDFENHWLVMDIDKALKKINEVMK